MFSLSSKLRNSRSYVWEIHTGTALLRLAFRKPQTVPRRENMDRMSACPPWFANAHSGVARNKLRGAHKPCGKPYTPCPATCDLLFKRHEYQGFPKQHHCVWNSLLDATKCFYFDILVKRHFKIPKHRNRGERNNFILSSITQNINPNYGG